ncbi:hypothetical protein DSO57_1018346 [Entomophthora muscae]|uniref:Uncharacterized protein n=1 Tax=Entomophthora muscae TaxID=34485 RepID=A0ACC2TRF7_9FUNG|nr:hypothetical protein DSO57_1018346 [Entomophthora muscae]
MIWIKCALLIFSLFCAAWIFSRFCFNIHTIYHTTSGELNAEYEYALEKGIRWSTRQGYFKEGPLPAMEVSKSRVCQVASDREVCNQVKSTSYLLHPKILVRDVEQHKFSPNTNRQVYLPLKYGLNINMPLENIFAANDPPTCKFKGLFHEKRKFIVKPEMCNKAWYKQVFIIVHYIQNKTLFTNGTSHSTITHRYKQAPLFDRDCNAQALVVGLCNS